MAFLRTAILLSTLTAIFVAVGLVIGGFAGMTIAFIMALVINFISYWFSDKIVLSMYRATKSDDKTLNAMVEKLARKAGIPKPVVYEVSAAVPNAFATGRDPNHSAIAVTKGLTDNLSNDEIEGVLAHEMAHIKNRDILVSTMAAVIAGAISYLAQLAWWSMMSDEDRRGNLILIPLIILAPIAAMLIHLAISRGREFGADDTGARITGKPRSLANALDKITNIAHENPVKGNAATSHMWIVNPFTADTLVGLFSTHPPVAERIEKLNRMKV
jgi:heat shock protein HtpX